MISVELILYAVFGGISLASAVMVITRKNPVHSALFLIVTFLSQACLYVLLNAHFLAAVQVIVYAGAIIVLFLFAIMLLNLGRIPWPQLVYSRFQVFVGIFLAGALFLEVLIILATSKGFGPPGAYNPEMINKLGNTQLVGQLLYTDFLFPFEVTSILLLVAIIGAVVLAKKRREGE
jgi:NADH-quinone oxidoreductase subunit J